MKRIISIVLFVFLLSVSCFANEWTPFSRRVSLEVKAEDSISSLIESYIGKELRSLGDVILTNDKPDYSIIVVAMEVTIMGGYNSGIAYAIAIIEPFDSEFWVNALQEYNNIDEKAAENVKQITTDLSNLKTLWVMTGNQENIQSSCKSIVADFDTGMLQPEREFYQKLVDSAQKQD